VHCYISEAHVINNTLRLQQRRHCVIRICGAWIRSGRDTLRRRRPAAISELKDLWYTTLPKTSWETSAADIDGKMSLVRQATLASQK